MSESTSHTRTRRKSSDNAVGARERSEALADDMQAHAGEAAGLLKVLAHEIRLLVLCHLSGGEPSVGEINERVSMSQSALSQHLAVLHDLCCGPAGKRS